MNIRKFVITILATMCASISAFGQADVQGNAINLISDFAGEEIVLQSSDYVFETRFGKVRVNLKKEDGSTVAKLVLTPPLEGDTGSMSNQAAALVSSLATSVGLSDSNSDAVMEAISAVVQNGVGNAGGSEDDVMMNVAMTTPSDNKNVVDVNLNLNGGETNFNADFKVTLGEGGNATVTGSVTGSGGTNLPIDMNITQSGNGASASGSIGNTNVSTNGSSKSEDVDLKEGTITDTNKDGTSKETQFTNNADGTTDRTETQKDKDGNVTSATTTNTTGQTNSSGNVGQGSGGSSSDSGNSSDNAGENTPDSTLTTTPSEDRSGADISGQDFSGRNLTGWNFSNAKAVGTNFSNATLSNANLSSADLTGANLKDANLVGANLNGIVIAGAQVEGANLSGATSNGLTAEQFYSTYNYSNNDMTGINLSNNNLAGWNFSGKNLQSVDMSNTTMRQQRFHDGATIDNVNLSNSTANIETTSGAAIGGFFSRSDVKNLNIDGSSYSAKSPKEAYAITFGGANVENLSAQNATFNAESTGKYAFAFVTDDNKTRGQVNGLNLSNSTLTATVDCVSNPDSGVAATGLNMQNSDVENVVLDGMTATAQTTFVGEGNNAVAHTIMLQNATINGENGLTASDVKLTASSKNTGVGGAYANGIFLNYGATSSDNISIENSSIFANAESSASAVARGVNAQSATLGGVLNFDKIEATAKGKTAQTSALGIPLSNIQNMDISVNAILSAEGETSAISNGIALTKSTISGQGDFHINGKIEAYSDKVAKVHAMNFDQVVIESGSSGTLSSSASMTVSAKEKATAFGIYAVNSTGFLNKNISIGGDVDVKSNNAYVPDTALGNTFYGIVWAKNSYDETYIGSPVWNVNYDVVSSGYDTVMVGSAITHNVYNGINSSYYSGELNVQDFTLNNDINFEAFGSNSLRAYGTDLSALNATGRVNINGDIKITTRNSNYVNIAAQGVRVADVNDLLLNGNVDIFITSKAPYDENSTLKPTGNRLNAYSNAYGVYLMENSTFGNVKAETGDGHQYLKITSQSSGVLNSTAESVYNDSTTWAVGFRAQNVTIDTLDLGYKSYNVSVWSNVWAQSAGAADVQAGAIGIGLQYSTINSFALASGGIFVIEAYSVRTNAISDVEVLNRTSAAGINMYRATLNGDVVLENQRYNIKAENDNSQYTETAAQKTSMGTGAYGINATYATFAGSQKSFDNSIYNVSVTGTDNNGVNAFGAAFRNTSLGDNVSFNNSKFTISSESSNGNWVTATGLDFEGTTVGKNLRVENSTFDISTTAGTHAAFAWGFRHVKTDDSQTLFDGVSFKGSSFKVSAEGAGESYAYGIYFKKYNDAIGGTFQNVDFSGITYDISNTSNAAYSYAIGISKATFGDNANFANSNYTSSAISSEGNAIARGVRFIYSTFGVNANFSGSTYDIKSDAVTNASSFGIEVSNGTFGEGADFSGSTYVLTSNSDSGYTKVLGVEAANAIFEGSANFSGSEYTLDATAATQANTIALNIYRAIFENVADFSGSTYDITANATTRSNVASIWGDGVTFMGTSDFSNSNYTVASSVRDEVSGNHGINFYYATFNGNANFENSNYNVKNTSGRANGIDLTGVNFGGDVKLNDSIYDIEASNTVDTSNLYGAGVYADGATFGGLADFSGSTYNVVGKSDISTISAYGLSLSSANFAGIADFSDSTYTVSAEAQTNVNSYGINANGTKFTNSANFNNTNFDIAADSVTGTSMASALDVSSATIADGTTFSNANFKAQATSDSGEVIAYGVNAKNATIGQNIDFTNAKFDVLASSNSTSTAFAYGLYFREGSNINNISFARNTPLESGDYAIKVSAENNRNADAYGMYFLLPYRTGHFTNSDFSGLSYKVSAKSNAGIANAYGLYFFIGDIQNMNFSNSYYDISARGASELAYAYGLYFAISNDNYFGDINLKGSTYKMYAEGTGEVCGVMLPDRAIGVAGNFDASNSVYDITSVDSNHAYGMRAYHNEFAEYADFSNSTYTIMVNSKSYPSAAGVFMEEAVFKKGADFSNSKFTVTSELRSNWVYGAIFYEATLNNMNFQNCMAQITIEGVDRTETNAMYLDYANINGADFRGSNISNTNINRASSLKNIIYSDGKFKNFTVDSTNSLSILAHKPLEGKQAITAKIFDENAVVNGGTLELLEGAQLEVLNGKSLTIDNGGELKLVINPLENVAPIMFSDAASFLLNDGKIVVELTQEILVEASLTLMTWTDDCDMLTLDNLIKEGNIFVHLKEAAYTRPWDYMVKGNSLTIVLTQAVPEPAEWAAILGALALGLAMYIRRKR